MAGSLNQKLILLILILLPNLAVQARVQGKKHGPKCLQLFAHESRVPPTNTLTVSASPSGSRKGSDEFGLIRTVSNVLREGRSNESKEIGTQVGIVVVGKDSNDVYISFTYFLNENATHQGTIALHGHILANSTADRAFAVVGGTGEFLAVTGEDRSAYDGNPPDPANVVNVHNLTFFYPHW
ncbi:unnamed protein product [Calypogeia fissa]